MKLPHCPHCRTKTPMRKAGFQMYVGGKPDKQRYECRKCRRFTTKPKWREQKAKKER